MACSRAKVLTSGDHVDERGAEVTIWFGTLLRQLRNQADLTQEQLADRAGVGVRTIRRLESATAGDPRVATVYLLADALNATPETRQKMLASIGRAQSGEELPPPDSETGDNPPPAEGVAPASDSMTPVWRTDAEIALLEAAEQLKQLVESRWQREEEHRRVNDPFPLPVRFQPVAGHLIDNWANINLALPEEEPEPLDLTGDLGNIAATYRKIPSGRLVVLGEAGSGKTILTLRFALDFLRTRNSNDPVPVVFSLGSWDPAAAVLRDWLIDQLLRDYPGLVARAPNGSTLAAALVEAGHILPVLDGFDEVADGLHAAALKGLNATTLPLLLTSRPTEYTKAAKKGALARAAGVELIGLTPADLVGYLPRTTRAASGDRGTPWAPVLGELRDHPDSLASTNLATALSTPLMVGLARSVYSDATEKDPADLLDVTRFPAPDDIEDHLVESFVPTVYQPEPPTNGHQRRDWEPELVQRWLGYLSRHLDQRQSPNIEWWELADSVRRSSRILTVTLAGTFATGLVDFLFFVVAFLSVREFSAAVGLALLDALMVGPLIGLSFGLIYGVVIMYGGGEFKPAYMRLQLVGSRKRAGGRSSRTFATRFGAGALTGLVIALGYAPTNTIMRGIAFGFPPTLEEAFDLTLIRALLYGLTFALVAGSGFAVAYSIETPLDISSAANPVAMLASNRKAVLRGFLILTPILILSVAIVGQLVFDIFDGIRGPLRWGPNGLAVGLIGGLGGAAAYALGFTAWGQWALISRIWLPLTGRLPWAIVTFLKDAYQRGVLRQAGAVYQFRHGRLQDHLCRTALAEHTMPARIAAPADRPPQ